MFLAVLLAGCSGAYAAEPLPDLRLEVHPAKGNARLLMVFLSGDGGWQDLDKQVTRHFNEAGIGVIGLNSLDYFFQEKTPRRLAHDLDRIVSTYGQAWHVNRIVLTGYSFGADALPFAWPHLSQETRQHTQLIALLGLVPAADFRISLWEMLDIPSADDIPVGPALRALPMDKTICIYGAEDETACTLPELRRATRIERPGGHHFDGNYAAISRFILQRLPRY